MENRAIISIIILATFGGLMALVASDYTGIDAADYQLIDVPNSLHGSEFINANLTDSVNMTITATGNQEFTLVTDEYIVVLWESWNPYSIAIFHKAEPNWWGGFDLYQRFEPYPVTWSTILAELEESTNQSVHYLTTKKYNWKVSFTFNETAYNNITHSWENNELQMQVGKGSEAIVDMTAWGVVTSILTWSNPDIHPAVNFFIAVPLYAMISVVLVYMFTKIAGALIPL